MDAYTRWITARGRRAAGLACILSAAFVLACLISGGVFAQDEEPVQVEDAPPAQSPHDPGMAPATGEVQAQEPGQEPEVVQEPAPTPPPPIPQPGSNTRVTPPNPVRPPSPRAFPSPPPAPPATPAASNGVETTKFRPSEGKSQNQDFEVNYEDTSLLDIIKSIGAMTGKNFDVDPGLAQQKATIIAHEKIPADMAYQVLESILASRGFSMTPTLDGNLVKVVPTQDSSEKIPLVLDGTASLREFDTLRTHIVPVQHADASELSDLLKSVGSKNANLRVYAKTNMLIITDNADGIRNMLRLLEEIDIPGFDTKMEIFRLEYTRAETLAQQILDVLQADGSAQQPRSSIPGQTVRPVTSNTARPPRPGMTQAQSIVVGNRQEVLRIVPDERMNALIVQASDGMMERVRELIDMLDKELPYEANNMNIIELQNAPAEKVVEALNGIIGTASPRKTSSGGGNVPGGSQAGSNQQLDEVQPFEKKVVITKYEQTNALIVLASPQDFKVLKDLISRLDVPSRQVHVEAIIMDVVLSDKFSLAIETTALTGNDGFALNNVVNLANLLSKGAVAGAAGAGATMGIIKGTTTVNIPGADGTVSAQTIPNIPLLLKCLESITYLDILSRPSLTTLDNEKANFVVGQEVPFITGSSRSLDQTTVNSSVFSSVQREDVGIKLDVTPQISEGDNVMLELSVEVSQTVASDVGADVNVVGPTVSKSAVKDKVVIQNGSTGVIAGLVSENVDRSTSHPPVLGDIPVVGWLLKTKSSNRGKRNLAVLVTPNIVRENVDLERLTEHRLEDFNTAAADILFEKGFIKRIGKKVDAWKNYRPSPAASEAMLGAPATDGAPAPASDAPAEGNGGRVSGATGFSQGNMGPAAQ